MDVQATEFEAQTEIAQTEIVQTKVEVQSKMVLPETGRSDGEISCSPRVEHLKITTYEF